MKSVLQGSFAGFALLSFSVALLNAQTWTQTSAPNTNWSCVASSADGNRLVAAVYGGLIYASTSSGLTWAPTSAAANCWESIACSAVGTELFVAGNFFFCNLPIYYSTNSGANWQTSGYNGIIRVVCSADGSKLAGVGGGQLVVVSTNSGQTWETLGPDGFPTDQFIGSIASSADGNTLAVVTTTHFGPPSLLLTTPTSNWLTTYVAPYGEVLYSSVAMSADGTRFVATVNNFGSLVYPPQTNWNSMLYSASNSGATVFTNYTPVTNWTSVAGSADGIRLVAVSGDGAIYRSTNSGATWGPLNAPNAQWTGVASSADGGKLVAVATNGGIYTWQTTIPPALDVALSSDGFTLSWVIPSRNFVLQQNSNLATTNWTDVPSFPVLNTTNLHNEVAAPATTNRVFFRLVSH